MKRPLTWMAIGFCCLSLGVSLVSKVFAQATGLDVTPPFLLSNYNQGTSGYIRQHRSVGGIYQQAWSSSSLNETYGMGGNMSAGDIDNDGVDEIFAVTKYLTRSVKVGKNTSYYFKQKLVVFEQGAEDRGLPSWEIDDIESGESKALLLDCVIADVDGDTTNKELVVLDSSHVDVYRIDGTHAIAYRYPGPPLGQITFSIDAGDVDGCGRNEIVVAMNMTGAPYILKFDRVNGFSAPVLADPIDPSLYGTGFTWLMLEYARVRDTDNDGKMEIIGGGNNSRFMIWKHDPVTGKFRNVFVSAYLGPIIYSLGVDSGDIDGDGLNEIVSGTSAARKVLPVLWVFAYDGVTYSLANSYRLPDGALYRVEVGNLDGDAADEIAVTLGGVRIFNFQGPLGAGTLTQVYYNSNGGAFAEIFH
jgi:hypothetical protein